jgi:hypothetical protein
VRATKVRAGRGRALFGVRVSDCARCLVRLELRRTGAKRTVVLKPASGRARVAVALRAGRWRWRLVAVDRGTGAVRARSRAAALSVR